MTSYQVSIPTLTTERLLLRGPAMQDFASSFSLWSDTAVTRHIGGRPLQEEECWSRFLRYLGHWTLLGFGYWIVEERETGAFLGEVGFSDYKRNIDPSLGDRPEIGWIIAPFHHGKGYATEAVTAALQWGSVYLQSKEAACFIEPGNHASVRVAERCGFTKYSEGIYKDSPVVIYTRPF